MTSTATDIVLSVNDTDRPPRPSDISSTRITPYLKRAEAFRNCRPPDTEGCSCPMCQGNDSPISRETLIALCTPEQRLTLLHYGFIEHGKIGPGPRFRIHWMAGNNVSTFVHYQGYAALYSLDCYVPGSTSISAKLISNLLALRTDEANFVSKACNVRPVESANDIDYVARNLRRAMKDGICMEPV